MWEQARNRYRELSNEKKNEKRESGRNRCQNMSEENKQKLKEYQNNYREAKEINIKKFCLFFPLCGVKMEQKALIFDKQCLNANLGGLFRGSFWVGGRVME